MLYHLTFLLTYKLPLDPLDRETDRLTLLLQPLASRNEPVADRVLGTLVHVLEVVDHVVPHLHGWGLAQPGSVRRILGWEGRALECRLGVVAFAAIAVEGLDGRLDPRSEREDIYPVEEGGLGVACNLDADGGRDIEQLFLFISSLLSLVQCETGDSRATFRPTWPP